MKIDIEKLLTISNFSKSKDLSRQHVYKLIKDGELSQVTIDGVKFIYLDEKSLDFVKKRRT